MRNHAKLGVLPALLMTVACGNEPAHVTPASHNLIVDDQVEMTTQALTAGTFTIASKKDGTKCLTVADGKNANGASIQLADCSGGSDQKWQHKNGRFRIFGDKCLNVSSGNDENGTRLQIWTCNDNDNNSKWTDKDDQLQWKDHSRCLDISGGNTSSGTPIQLWDCDSSNENQSWAFSNAQSSGSSSTTTVANSQAVFTGAAGIGPSPTGTEVVPYFWTWGRWGNFAISSLTDARSKANMQGATIAFGLSGGGCAMSTDLTDMSADILSYIQAGGRVILSVGGASGTYPQTNCSDSTALANALDGQLKALNTHALDFDIEGQNLNTMDHTNVLLDALRILQGRYSDLYVSFTLPVDDNAGLPSTALSVINGAKNKGVNVSRVNIMAMDFGHGPSSGQDMGDQCINAATATFNQLKSIYSGVADATLWHMIGITPMIGENDDHYKFTTDHAQKVANFAKSRGIGLLSFWGMQRDRSGSGSLDNFTNVTQSNFQFLSIFNGAR